MKKTSKFTRGLSLLMALIMILGFLPAQHVHAASNVDGGLEGQAADVFTALGFDTSVMPEGYDADTVDNPYGRDKITGNQYFEMLIAGNNGMKSIGKDDNDATVSGSVGSVSGTSVPLEIFNGAAGDFDGDGLPGEVIYVGLPAISLSDASCANPPLNMYLYDGKTDSFSGAKQIASVKGADYEEEDFYWGGDGHRYHRSNGELTDINLYGYTEVTAGDFDGDGYAEIAVYVPESGRARVDIYKWMRDANSSDTDWKNWSNWSVVWSHTITNGSYTPNMVSLVSADINQDGIDDLGLSYSGSKRTVDQWGNVRWSVEMNSKALILWGAKNNMLQKNTALNLCEADLGTQFRTSLTVGDINGDSYLELVATGQPSTNFTANTTRSVVVYAYDGNGGLTVLYSGNQKVVDGAYETRQEKNDQGELVNVQHWVSNNSFDGEYLSMPYVRTNAAVVKLEGYDYGYLYLDSCIYEFIEGSLTLKMCLDDASYDGTNTLGSTWLSSEPYIEYSASAADVNGNGFHQLYTGFAATNGAASYASRAPIEYPEDDSSFSYRSTRFGGYGGLQGNDGGTLTAKTHSETVDDMNFSDTTIAASSAENFPYYAVTVADVDKDTTILEYTGNHWLTYQDPKVLAVIAAAPYFEDVDVICDYDYAWQNATSWSKTEGTGHGDSVQVDFEIGGFVSQGSKFNDLEVAALFTLEWAKETTKTTEYTLSFETSQDEDAVAFFSIPTEHYEYTIYAPNEDGVYEQDTYVVSRPFRAVYQVLTLDYYESIRKDYDNLPAIRGKILTSTPGDPSSYPASTAGYDVITKWKDDPAGISFGNGAITQEITVTTEESESYNLGAALDVQAGGGYKGETVEVIAGVTFSLNPSGGWVDLTINGTTIAGTVTNMPLEFQDYGYYYDWSLFSYAANIDGGKVPVVSYVVGSISEPPQLPDDFQQDVERTTADKNVLTWTYDGDYSSFILYRYFDFPIGGGLQEIARFAAGEAPYTLKTDENGKPYYEFYYEDTNLAPYSEYEYAIQVERLSEVPPLSAPSGLLTARTKAAEGNPLLTIDESDGENDGYAMVYPDKNSYLIAQVSGPDGQKGSSYYTTIQYQWQKMNKHGKWEDLINETNQTLTFATSGSNVAGEYRCRINVITNTDNTAISTYTKSVEMVHSKRTSIIQDAYALEMAGKVKMYAKVANAHTDSATVPDGYVTFNFVNAATNASYPVNVPLDSTGVASVISNNSLPEGQYRVYVTYSGSYIFKSSDKEIYYLSGQGAGYAIEALSAITYGEGAVVEFKKLSSTNGMVTTENVDAASFAIGVTKIIQTSASFNSSTGTRIYTGDVVVQGEKYHFRRGGFNYSFTASADGTFAGLTGGILAARAKIETFTEKDYLTKDTAAGVYRIKDNTPAGTYQVRFTDSSGNLYSKAITITRRSITLQLPDLVKKQDAGAAMGDLTYGELSVVSGSWAPCDADQNGNITGTVAAASVAPTYTNTAGTAYNKNSKLDICGYYTISAEDTLDNYAVTYRTGSLSVIGGNQPVTFGVRPFQGQDVGTLYMVSPDYAYTREDKGITMAQAVGSRIVFTAAPDEGYQVYDWYVDGVAQGVTDTRFSYVMLNQSSTVEVQFVFKPDTLIYGITGDLAGGTLTCSDGNLTSGSIVIPNTYATFTAKAKEGYHFKEWRYTELGKGTAYYNEDDGKQSSTFELLMPKTSCSLYAVFERDGYTLTYTDKAGLDGFTAWYWGIPGGDTTAALEQITVKSGDSVPGDTEIVIQAKAGYALHDDYNFVATGSQGVADYDKGTYTLKLTEDTHVTGYTTQNSYEVTVMFDVEQTYAFPEGAQIKWAAEDWEEYIDFMFNGREVFASGIPGGTPVTVSAIYPDYYTFEGWNVNGTIVDKETVTINELGEDTTFTLILKEKPVHQVTLANISGKGTYSITLPNGAGQSGNVITCHENDPLTIQVTPESGYTVTYWNVSSVNGAGWETKASSLKYQFPQLTEDYTFTPVFSGTTYHVVSWPTLPYYDVTLTPAAGYLSTVATGGDFKFTLSGTEYSYVLSNGLEFRNVATAASDFPYVYETVDGAKVYTIRNIKANQEITVTTETPNHTLAVEPSTITMYPGQSATVALKYTGATPTSYKWDYSNGLKDNGDGTFTFTLHRGTTPNYNGVITIDSYVGTTKLATTKLHLKITDAVKDIAVTTSDLEVSSDGSYLIHPITPTGEVGKYDFDAEATFQSDATSKDITWSVWGAQMRSTTIDSNGVLTVSHKEYGTNGQMKVIATYTFADGATYKKEVQINLSPDAYVATEVTGADHGDVMPVGYVAEDSVTVIATPDENHAVACWYVNGVAVSGEVSDTMTFAVEEMTFYQVSVEFTHYYPTVENDDTNHWYECSCGDKIEIEEHFDFDKNHNCDLCDFVMSTCADDVKDHKCDYCGAVLSECYDTIQDHICDWCGVKVSECYDENTDHYCDWCDDELSVCEDANNNHFCDYCKKTLTECADEDKDHYCDICERKLTDCGDNNKDHFCDICNIALTTCADGDQDHNCDLCGKVLTACEDTNKDHDCDYCGKEDITECVDVEPLDHYCDICGAEGITECTDATNNHNCDICGEKISECADEDNDHKCDTCGEKISDCADATNDHKCDICGAEGITDCVDADNDHNCDICGEKISDCADATNDHNCDICGDKITNCADADDHYCDICGKHLTSCEDADEDGFCDVCGAEMNAHDCADGNSDHKCDICGKEVTVCDDADTDHKCDICGKDIGIHQPAEGSHNCDYCGKAASDCVDKAPADHFCDICGADLGDCADNDHNHYCDVCGTEMSDCADETNDHICDVCGKTYTECADNDDNHKCDICQAVLTSCDDADKDHACDICGETVTTCVDDDHNHICDICEETISQCADGNNDHYCDLCGEIVSEHKDEADEETGYADHICDICGIELGQCEDVDPADHKCDTCGAVLSQCEDKPDAETGEVDYICDICGADMHICTDEETVDEAGHTDHLCDICGYKLSDCADETNDHKCDICGATGSICEDTDNDHLCNICGDKISECIDETKDHICDLCGEKASECVDADHNDACDICGKAMYVHVDEDHNHRCDVCQLSMSECDDVDKDHICDYCGAVWSVCADNNTDHKCDVCGTSMGNHAAPEGSHICDYCGKAASECADGNNDHYCDICGEKLSECIDNVKDHYCDICGASLTVCADNDNDHKCDWCGATLSQCQDTDSDHLCDTCGDKISQCQDTNPADHYCDICGEQISKCIDDVKDHKCDICGRIFGDCADEDGDHMCDYCGKRVTDCYDDNDDHICEQCGGIASESSDADRDHFCDICGEVLSECGDSNQDHICDLCGTLMDSCVDENKDHVCDYCGKTISQCADDVKDHKCDYCGAVMSECADDVKDHKCDWCGAVLSQCDDTDKDHICNWCDAVMSECYDDVKDHKCDYCGVVMSTCADDDKDHNCDWCGTVMSVCADEDKDHDCDYCGAILSQCDDADKDHDCDYCDDILTECHDTIQDHICDWCGAVLSQCDDADKDHDCDWCCTILSECDDADKDHDCDYCGAILTVCNDADKNHKCDWCGAVLSQCDDADKDHDCDYCDVILSDCADDDKDHICDWCGAVLSTCADEDKDHDCDYCGAILSECADCNRDHKCDYCGKTISSCVNKNRDHKCDYCCAIISSCVDENKNHKCDICNKTMTMCADNDKDHKCDICGATLSKCVNKNWDRKCDICGAAMWGFGQIFQTSCENWGKVVTTYAGDVSASATNLR